MIFDNIPLLNQLPPEVREVILRILLAILALLLTWALRRLLARLVVRPFERRSQRTATPLDNQILEIARPALQWLVLAFGLWLAVNILGLDLSRESFLQSLLRTLVAVAVTIAVYRLVDLISLSSNQLQDLIGVYIEERLIPFVRVFLRLVVIVIALTVILQIWGYDVNALVAGLGIGTLGISLAAQDTIANLFGFAAIVTDRPFNVGDMVEIEKVEGTVEHVGLRATIIRRADQARVYIPNSTVAKAPITNWSRLAKRRLEMTLTVKGDLRGEAVQGLISQFRGALESRARVDRSSVEVVVSEVIGGGVKIRVVAFVLIAGQSEFLREQQQILLNLADLVRAVGAELG